uniref:Uncharacterized protein n=1 Tax=Plectus sambesii TaxID=2011161 RepID=A0A914XIL0_9BILA
MNTEIRTTTKVEDDRSLGEKAKDAMHNAAEKTKDMAHNLKEKVIGEGHVTDSDIARAEMKQQELGHKEKIDRMRAEGAADRKEELHSNFQNLQDKEFANRMEAARHHEKRMDQADEVNRLQYKQNQQQAERCHEALNRQGACPTDSGCKVTRVTETH